MYLIDLLDMIVTVYCQYKRKLHYRGKCLSKVMVEDQRGIILPCDHNCSPKMSPEWSYKVPYWPNIALKCILKMILKFSPKIAH